MFHFDDSFLYCLVSMQRLQFTFSMPDQSVFAVVNQRSALTPQAARRYPWIAIPMKSIFEPSK